MQRNVALRYATSEMLFLARAGLGSTLSNMRALARVAGSPLLAILVSLFSPVTFLVSIWVSKRKAPGKHVSLNDCVAEPTLPIVL